MNIVLLNDYAFINGGAGQVCINSSVAFAKRGYHTILFAGVGPVASQLKNIPNLDVFCLDQYDILNDPKRWRAICKGLWNRCAAKEFDKILGNLDTADTIVHIHSCAKALSSSCIRVAVKRGFKVVFHMHDYGLACPNMGFFHYRKQQICNLKALRFNCIKENCDSRSYLHKLWRWMRQLIQEKFGLLPGYVNCFIAVSAFSYRILKPYLPDRADCIILPNPIEVYQYPRVMVESNRAILFIGRLSPEKNPVLLAKSARKLGLPVIFVGGGPCAEEVKTHCPHAIITGWIEFEKIESYLRRARCLVLPSVCYETQGMVVEEAAARGVPAIVPESCAAGESIIANQTGLFFRHNCAVSLEEQLLKIQCDAFVKNMGIIAYQNFWSKKEEMEDYFDRLVRIYHQNLSSCIAP